ncbi:MAG: hypothetical protein QXR65_09570 [Candidatus Bathyarchaeia archaeon]
MPENPQASSIIVREAIAPYLTVGMIMTPRSEMCTFKPRDKVSYVLAEMEEGNYDAAPIEDDGVLDRFVERKRLKREDPSLPCGEVAQNISVRHIVSEQMAMEDLLPLFCEQGFFFVMGQREITGIVTYADLNKTPAKVLFYFLISELERGLLRLIRQRFKKIEGCLEYLDQKALKDIEEALAQAKGSDTDLSIEHYFSTSHIVKIVSKDAELRKKLDFRSKKQAEKVLNPLVDLRNRTMHPRGLIRLIERRNEVEKLKQKYDALRDLIDKLRD